MITYKIVNCNDVRCILIKDRINGGIYAYRTRK